MTLGEIFEQGHRVAFSREPFRFVVRAPNPPAPEGWWLVGEESLPAVVVRRRVEANDLSGSLSGVDMQASVWIVDDDHCWCENCRSSRKLLETQDE